MSAVELHSAVIVAESEKAPLCEQVGACPVRNF